MMHEEDVCAICLCIKEYPTKITKGKAMCDCTHEFCQRCVVKFVNNKLIKDISCPMCREPCLEEMKANRRYIQKVSIINFRNRIINRTQFIGTVVLGTNTETTDTIIY